MPLVVFDIPGFVRAWSAIQVGMNDAGALAFKRAVKDAWVQMQGFGYDNQTGALTRSMKWKTVHPSIFNYRGEVSATAKYAKFVDDVTKPHDIPGPGKGPSVFFWPKIGRWVTFTSDKPAKHPGTRAAGFSGAAAQAFLQTAPMLMEHAMGTAANKS